LKGPGRVGARRGSETGCEGVCQHMRLASQAEGFQDAPPARPIRSERQVPVFARLFGETDKIPIASSQPFKLPLERGRLTQMEVPAMATDQHPCWLAKGDGGGLLYGH
jgi:hypothetical protein